MVEPIPMAEHLNSITIGSSEGEKTRERERALEQDHPIGQ